MQTEVMSDTFDCGGDQEIEMKKGRRRSGRRGKTERERKEEATASAPTCVVLQLSSPCSNKSKGKMLLMAELQDEGSLLPAILFIMQEIESSWLNTVA